MGIEDKENGAYLLFVYCSFLHWKFNNLNK